MITLINLQRDFGSMLLDQVGGAASSLMGMALSPITNQIQQGQQQALTNMQLNANEQLSAYNYNQQYDLWQKTNYPAQVQELEQAGLNPALLYAKGGPGGTTGTPTTGAGMGIAAGQSPAQTAQTIQQGAIQQAQVDNLNAQTKKIEAETPGAAGLQASQTALNLANTDNAQANAALTKAQTFLQNINNNIADATSPDAIAQIRANASSAQEQFDIIARNNWLDAKTLQTRIDQFNANLLQTYAETNLIKSNTQLSQSNIQVNNQQIQAYKQQIANWANEIVQSRSQQAINRQNATTQSDQQQTNDNMYQLTKRMFDTQQFNKPIDQFMEGISNIIPHFITPLSKQQPQPRNPVGFQY